MSAHTPELAQPSFEATLGGFYSELANSMFEEGSLRMALAEVLQVSVRGDAEAMASAQHQIDEWSRAFVTPIAGMKVGDEGHVMEPTYEIEFFVFKEGQSKANAGIRFGLIAALTAYLVASPYSKLTDDQRIGAINLALTQDCAVGSEAESPQEFLKHEVFWWLDFLRATQGLQAVPPNLLQRVLGVTNAARLTTKVETDDYLRS